MTDMINLARRICMGEHIPPLKDGPVPDDEHPTSERREEDAERRARAESEEGDATDRMNDEINEQEDAT